MDEEATYNLEQIEKYDNAVNMIDKLLQVEVGKEFRIGTSTEVRKYKRIA